MNEKFYVAVVGTMYVQSFKLDPVTKKLLYVKLNPNPSYARLIDSRAQADQVAAAINGSVIAYVENEKDEL